MCHPIFQINSTLLAAGLALTTLAPTALLASGPGDCQQLLTDSDPKSVAQNATADDMKIFERYVGEYHSARSTFDDGETEYYFVLNYDWYDDNHKIMRFKVSMVIPAQDRVLVRSEGFYGYDPFAGALFSFGAFTNGQTGLGLLHHFDHATGARALLARTMGADGSVTLIDDQFELVEEGVWKNRAFACSAATGEWKQVYEGVYTRI